MKNIQKRFVELDLWRSLAIIGMIVYHIIFLLVFLHIMEIYYFRGGWWLLGHFVRFSFLLLVGISLNLSWQKSMASAGDHRLSTTDFYIKQLKRSAIVLGAALLITLVSYLIFPDQYIGFGVLHLIAVSIFFLTPLAGKPNYALLLSLIILFVPVLVSITSDTGILALVIGAAPESYKSLDYFPVFPWMALPALGIFLGHLCFKNYERRLKFLSILDDKPWVISLATIGKKSLLIYMIHIPILVGLIFGVQYLLKIFT